MMSEPTLDTLTQRLDRLERGNRWWKMLAIAAVSCLMLVLFVGASHTRSTEEIRAKRFVVVDESGQRRLLLGGVRGGVDDPRNYGLFLVGKNGKVRAEFYEGKNIAGRDGVYLNLKGIQRKGELEGILAESIMLSAGSEYSSVAVFGSGGQKIDLYAGKSVAWSPEPGERKSVDEAYVGVKNPEALASLSVSGREANLSFGAPKPGGRAWIGMGLNLEDGSASLGLGGEKPFLSLHDETRKLRARLGHVKLETQRTGEITETHAGSLVLFGKDGNLIWKAP